MSGVGGKDRKKENSRTFSTLNGIISIKTYNSYFSNTCFNLSVMVVCKYVWGSGTRTMQPLNLCSHGRTMTSTAVMSRLCTNAHRHFGLWLLSQRTCAVNLFQCASDFMVRKHRWILCLCKRWACYNVSIESMHNHVRVWPHSFLYVKISPFLTAFFSPTPLPSQRRRQIHCDKCQCVCVRLNISD